MRHKDLFEKGNKIFKNTVFEIEDKILNSNMMLVKGPDGKKTRILPYQMKV
jgi:hypothetical protein